ncbi:unnamed protein product [Cuscuta campestris]|uniref:Uncharacterized protein n=1 Tax=Cuscuta campestris TaxID=132261 RepID=A0A484M561_9ASTE|nr:unnamed protein product [Cuscuta campestris]
MVRRSNLRWYGDPDAQVRRTKSEKVEYQSPAVQRSNRDFLSSATFPLPIRDCSLALSLVGTGLDLSFMTLDIRKDVFVGLFPYCHVNQIRKMNKLVVGIHERV